MQDHIAKFIISHQWADYIPFIGLMAGQPHGAAPLITRLLETAVMAAIATGFGVYVTVEVMKQDVSYLKAGVADTQTKIERVDEKVEQLRRDLYVPRYGVGGGAGS